MAPGPSREIMTPAFTGHRHLVDKWLWALVVSNHRPPPRKGDSGGDADQRYNQNHSWRHAVFHSNASHRFASFSALSRILCGTSTGGPRGRRRQRSPAVAARQTMTG